MSAGITETGKVGNTGSNVANAFTLQINSEFFSGSPACDGAANPSSCQAWQQFVYSYQSATGFVYMQYWLIDYDTTCPSGWFSFSTDCYTNSSAATMAPLKAKQLAHTKFFGSAASGGNDEVSLTVGSGPAVAVTNSDSMLDLSAFWNTSEWAVLGDGGGGEAFFSAGTTLEAQQVLTATSHVPGCLEEGFTAETNNLSLTTTPALGSKSSPTVATEQTNSTAGTPSCATAG